MDVGRVRQTLQAAAVVELQNDVVSLQRGTAVLHLAGVDDIMVAANDLDAVLAKLPPDGPAILLAHEPDFADQSAATGRFALQLSGHSHGGQIVLPKIGPLRGPMFKKYPNGRYQVGSMVQYTNRGVGTHTIRLRVNCRPEITVITLRSS
jgi:predicted MPP superfamily phosphohydrolase